MTVAGDVLKRCYESGLVQFRSLPADLRQWITSQVFHYGGIEQSRKLDQATFKVVRVPLAAFPKGDALLSGGFFNKEKAQGMIGKQTPPVVMYKGYWCDGRHRVWAARKAGLKYVDAIDIGDAVDLGDYGEANELPKVSYK